MSKIMIQLIHKAQVENQQYFIKEHWYDLVTKTPKDGTGRELCSIETYGWIVASTNTRTEPLYQPSTFLLGRKYVSGLYMFHIL